ncbi:hypothetical protein F5879DRAFT_1068424 [Lentinula edodes]|nr:hypothetical protein F5879DRAFT_1068424 [Lentinula edodes]
MNRKRKAFDDIFDSNRKRPTRTRFAEASFSSTSDSSLSTNLTLPGSSLHVSSPVATSSSSHSPSSLSALQTSSYQPFAISGMSTSRTFTEVFKGRIEPTFLVRSISATSVEPSTSSVSGTDHDYDLSVMASTVLNGDVVFGAQSPAAIDEGDLDPLVTLVQDAVTNMTNDSTRTNDTTRTTDMISTCMTANTDTTMGSYELQYLFDSPAAQNRTIHQALRRIQTHKVELQDRLVSLHNLPLDCDIVVVQEILFRAERAIVIISSELDKYRRKEVRSEVEATRAVARRLEGFLQNWRTVHPDSSPIQIDNSLHAYNPTTTKNTPTLIAYSLTLVGRIMERMSRQGTSLLLKSIRLFGYSLTLLQEGGPNQQQQAALIDIPEDIRVLEKKFNLDIKTTVFAVCPSCSFTHPPTYPRSSSTPTYPKRCTHRAYHLAEPCNENLLEDDKPIKMFEFHSFLDWFGRFLAFPGITEYGDCHEAAEAE